VVEFGLATSRNGRGGEPGDTLGSEVVMLWWALMTASRAGDLDTTEVIALTALDHGAWLAGVGVAAHGEPEPGLSIAAIATHIAILTTPVILYDLQPTDPMGKARMNTAWGLYWTGVGVTSAGWAAMGVFDDDCTTGGVLMTLADVALIGSAGVALHQALAAKNPGADPPAVVIPLVRGSF
jgi:hypothetical protein